MSLVLVRLKDKPTPKNSLCNKSHVANLANYRFLMIQLTTRLELMTPALLLHVTVLLNNVLLELSKSI